MPSEAPGSVSRLLAELKAGDRAAVQPLWERYFDRLVRLARARLRATSRAPADEEDAALSAFNSFCNAATRGVFPRLEDRDDLWQVLVLLTSRKAMAQIRHLERRKRGGGLVLNESELPDAEPSGAVGFLERVVGQDPTPEFAVLVAEQYQRLLDVLGDEMLRQVAVWRMEGYTNDEVAGRLGCARRTVARQLALIRKIWLDEESVT